MTVMRLLMSGRAIPLPSVPIEPRPAGLSSYELPPLGLWLIGLWLNELSLLGLSLIGLSLIGLS
jgi:hypothetical protein